VAISESLLHGITWSYYFSVVIIVAGLVYVVFGAAWGGLVHGVCACACACACACVAGGVCLLDATSKLGLGG
jgi:hypothetical protein